MSAPRLYTMTMLARVADDTPRSMPAPASCHQRRQRPRHQLHGVHATWHGWRSATIQQELLIGRDVRERCSVTVGLVGCDYTRRSGRFMS